MIRALIFDFGGVVTRTLFETHPQSEAALGLPPGTLTWRGPFAPETDAAWRAMQADEMTERDYWHLRTAEVAALTGHSWTQMSDFVRAARGAEPLTIIRPEFLALVSRARSCGLRLAILSNELDLFYGADIRARLPFLEAFEAIHDATYTRTLKPDPAAYEAVLHEMDLPGNACLFIDDQQRNIDGARAVGLQTHHFDVTRPIACYQAIATAAGISGDDP